MQHAMERHCRVYGWDDSQPRRRELRRQFLDAESESGVQQRPRRQWPTLDCYRRLFELHNCAKCSHWVSGFGYDQHRHKPGLDCSLRSIWL